MMTEKFANYAVRGYHIERGVFGAEEIAAMVAHFMAMSKEKHPGDFGGVAAKTQSDKPDPLAKYPRPINMHTWDELTRDLMHDERLTRIASFLMQQSAIPIQTMVYYKPPGARGQSFHQDNLYLKHTPLMGVWVALDRADAANGAMQMVRGSHLFGLLPCRTANTDISFTDSETVIPPNLTFDLMELEVGDVVSSAAIPFTVPYRTRQQIDSGGHLSCIIRVKTLCRLFAPPLPSAEAK